MHLDRIARVAAAALALTAVGCVDQPTAVRSPTPFAPGLASRTPSLAVSGGPDLSDYLSFQGEVWICKDGNQPGTSFAIDYTVVRTSDNTQVAAGTVTVPLGQCVLATSINTQIGGRYRATATEQAPPANWSLTAIDWAYGANLPITPAPPTVNLAARTISAVLVANDVGVQLTFTNTFTPPPPPPPPPAGCTYTQGYWKNHASAWPVTAVTVGTVTYTQAQALRIFGTPVRGNGLVSLTHQLMAAKLNIAAGANPAAASAAIASADALIGSKIVPSIGSGYLAPSTTSGLTSTLDNFNNGVTGPGHCN